MRAERNENETTSSSTVGPDGKDKDLVGAKEGKKDDKRYIPPYKKPDAALTFPEKVRVCGFILFVLYI